MITILDIIGVVAFSISGVLTSMRKQMDAFGILIVAFVTAIGGGTLRDVLLDEPVIWLTNLTYTYTIIVTVILAIIFQNKLAYLRKSLFLFDTIGLGLYTVVGIEKALAADIPWIICIAFGTMSACFGGVIRDILSNEVPIIFREEIYATACIAGGIVYFLLSQFHISINIIFIISISVVILIRILAVTYKISLPSVYK
ncbi:MAG: trimeric intracellular cation channel family protein [Psychroflexus sp.]|nr:trimeric intracellular cation channel family protein [Psychroflexus sp.]MDR9447707.1 trimeric intracellular cation channel family protein [Psychroflexus sp.]